MVVRVARAALVAPASSRDVRDAVASQLDRHPFFTTDLIEAQSRCLPTVQLDLAATFSRSATGRAAEIELRWILSTTSGRMLGLWSQRARVDAGANPSDAMLWQRGLGAALESTPDKLIGGLSPQQLHERSSCHLVAR